MKERIAYLDVVKCFAIALVCIGHSSWISPRGMSCPLVQWIYTFHMPLFMLMCGFFSKGLFELSVKEFVEKEVKRLVVPIVVFSGLKIGLLTLVGANVWRNELIGGMWFLRCLLFCDIIVYVGKKLCKWDWLVCIVSCVILFVMPRGTFLRTNYFLLIYWSGYFWRKYYAMYEGNVMWVTMSACILCFVFRVTGEPSIIHWGDWMNLLKFYSAGIGWSVAIIGVYYFVCRFVNLKWFAKVGAATLAIYCVNSLLGDGLLKESVLWKCNLSCDWMWIIIVGIVEFIVCYYLFLLYRFVKGKCGYIS